MPRVREILDRILVNTYPGQSCLIERSMVGTTQAAVFRRDRTDKSDIGKRLADSLQNIGSLGRTEDGKSPCLSGTHIDIEITGKLRVVRGRHFRRSKMFLHI